MLVLYNDLQDWDCLPVGGGYFDQPALLMRFLKQVRLAYADHQEIQEINRRLDKGAAEGSSHPGAQTPSQTVRIPLPF